MSEQLTEQKIEELGKILGQLLYDDLKRNTLREQLENLQGEIRKLKEEIKTKERECEESKNKLTRNLNEKNKALEDEQNKNSKIEQKKNELKIKLDEYEKKGNEFKLCCSERDSNKREYDRCHREKKEKDKQLKNNTSIIKNLGAEKRDLKERIEALNKSNPVPEVGNPQGFGGGKRHRKSLRKSKKKKK